VKEVKQMRKIGLVLVAAVLFTAAGMGLLYSQLALEDTQAKLILKIIPYDRNFSRFGDTVKIGVTSKKMLDALLEQKKDTLRGKKLVIEMLKSLEDIPNYSVIYVDRNWSKDYETACAKAIEKKILMFCGSHEAVEKSQAAIAFRLLQKKVKIVLNIKVTKSQGTDFPSNLLKLSLVVGNL
jgi:hypothetical protein